MPSSLCQNVFEWYSRWYLDWTFSSNSTSSAFLVFYVYILLCCSRRLCYLSCTSNRVHYPCSMLFSSVSLNCYFYTDDSQLYISHFVLAAFHYHLPANAVQHISACMTANLFTLNSSRTEFLIWNSVFERGLNSCVVRLCLCRSTG